MEDKWKQIEELRRDREILTGNVRELRETLARITEERDYYQEKWERFVIHGWEGVELGVAGGAA